MEVILLEDIRNLGKLGSQVNVKAGFARNYLLPQRKVVPATKENIAEFQARRAELEQTAVEQLQMAQARAEQISQLAVKLAVKVGDEGKLYGSIGVRELALAITAAGVEVQKSEVQLPAGPIREIGEFDVQVQLHSEVLTTVKIAIVDEKA